ncbi:hypothetical protein Tco_0675574, partial [Tanacetum coccineum]
IKNIPPNPLIAKYKKKNGKKSINYTLKPVTSAYLRWRDLPSMERHACSERLSSCDETLRDLMKMEYTHEDGDEFVDYSWERAFLIKEDAYQEWLCGKEHVFTLPEFVVILGLYELKEGCFAGVAWIITEYLRKKAPRIKENSKIYGGHYFTKIAKALGYYVDEEVAKCSEPIECEE